MRKSRSLSLKRESLADLTTSELGVVAGGQQELTHLACNVTDYCTHTRSFDEPCPTVPVNPCLSLDRPCIQID